MPADHGADPSNDTTLENESTSPSAYFSIDELGILSRGFDNPAAETPPITQGEVDWVRDQFPFIQVVTAGNTEATEATLLICPESNWNVIDYGNALCSSPGENLFTSGYFRTRKGNEDDEGGGIVTPNGTIINQMFTTAQFIVDVAAARNWASLHIIDGSQKMGRYIWIHGTRANIPVTNFTPNKADMAVAHRLRLSRDALTTPQSGKK